MHTVSKHAHHLLLAIDGRWATPSLTAADKKNQAHLHRVPAVVAVRCNTRDAAPVRAAGQRAHRKLVGVAAVGAGTVERGGPCEEVCVCIDAVL